MTRLTLKPLLTLTAISTLSIGISQAATYSAGDLLMGFVAGSGTGADQTLVVNLGPAATFRDAYDTGVFSTNIKTIGTQLNTQFGATWFDRTDLYISLFASTASDTIGDTLVNGDPFRTLYVSKSRLTETGSASLFTIASNTAITGTSSQIVSTSGVYAGAIADPSGVAIIPDAANTLDKFTKPVASNSFTNLNGGIEQAFAAGSWGTFGLAGTVEAALDLQRLQAVNNVAGQYDFGVTPIRRGDYTGTFTINNAGAISFVPEPTTTLVMGLTGLAALLRRRRP